MTNEELKVFVDDGTTLGQALEELRIDPESFEYYTLKTRGNNLIKFYGWTPNKIIFFQMLGFASFLDALPRNPPNENT